MSNLEIEETIFSKRVLSRLLGCAYDLGGTFLAPLKIAIKALFHEVCIISQQEWDKRIDDTKLNQRIVDFLIHIKGRLNNINPQPRAFLGKDFIPLAIIISTDGSSIASSFNVYMRSRNVKTGEINIVLIFSAGNLSPHTVPVSV